LQSFTDLSDDCAAERRVDINLVSHRNLRPAKTPRPTNGVGGQLFT